MPRETDAKILDLANRILGEREDGVLLRIGGHDLAVVAGEMRLGEVAGQGNADVEVFELVARTGLRDPNHVRLRLAILVVA